MPINIYPNPAFNQIVIETPITPGMNTSLTIFNFNGQQVSEHLITEPTTVVDIGALPNGLYLLRVIDDNTAHVSKFVKN